MTIASRWVRKTVKSDYLLRRICLSVHLSVCLSVRLHGTTERVFMEFDIWGLFRKHVEKIQASLKLKNGGNLTIRYVQFVTSAGWILLRMANISHRTCKRNQNIRFMFNNFFSQKILQFMRCGKIWQDRTGHRWQRNGSCALPTG